MNFFFDRNMPPRLAYTIQAFEESVHKIVHHDDDGRFHQKTTDKEWMIALSEDELSWIVISQDEAILKNRAERQVLREAKLTFFFLTKSWKTMPFREKAVKFIRVWERVIESASKVRSPTIFKISAGSGLKIDKIGLAREM